MEVRPQTALLFLLHSTILRRMTRDILDREMKQENMDRFARVETGGFLTVEIMQTKSISWLVRKAYFFTIAFVAPSPFIPSKAFSCLTIKC